MRRDTTAGFSLVELMVAVALMAVVVAWLTQTFTVQHRTYTVVEQVTETQQNSTAIAGLIEREIRSAGFLVPESAVVCGVDNTGGPDVLYVSASDLIDPDGVNNPDLGWSVTTASGANEGEPGVARNLALPNRVLSDGDGLGFWDDSGDGNNDSDLRQNMGVIVMDRANESRGAACGLVTFVPNAPTTGPPPSSTNLVPMNIVVDYDATMDGGVSATADLHVVPAHRYSIDLNNNLLRDGVVLAPDVEDMQVSYFYDLNGDDVVATGSERPGNPATGVYDPSDGWHGQDLREVHLSLVVRTRDQDPNQDFNEGTFQATENRVAPAGSDGFRRRVYTSQVRVRNVGFRD